MNLKEMSHECLIKAFTELHEQAGVLGAAITSAWPGVPVPRAPMRCITPSLYLTWDYKRYDAVCLTNKDPNTDYSEVVGIRFVIRSHENNQKPVWRDVPRMTWLMLFAKYMNSPRLVVRSLARVDGFTRWFVDRILGAKKALKDREVTQAQWVDKLQARFTLIEMSEKPLTQGVMKLTNGEYYLAKDSRIDAIKALRNRTGCSLVDAKNAVEKALDTGNSSQGFGFGFKF